MNDDNYGNVKKRINIVWSKLGGFHLYVVQRQ